MSDFIETLWREFAVETEEHLTLIESSLGSDGGDSAGRVDQLFRSFHSLKGLSRAMELRGMETTAHHAENVLGLVRDGTLPLDGDMATLLLQAVDVLTGMREHAHQTRTDQPAPDDLLASLDEVYKAAGGDTANGGDGGGGSGGSVSGGSGDPLQDDPEMIAFYVEGMQEHLPIIAGIVAPDIEDRAEVVDSIEILAHGAEVLDFAMLSDNLGLLGGLVPAEGGLDPQSLSKAIALIAEIREQCDILADISGVDAGLSEMSRRLAAHLDTSIEQDVRAFEDALTDLMQADLVSLTRSAARLGDLAQALHAKLHSIEAEQAANLIMLVLDVCRRMAQDEIPLGIDLLEAMQDAARTVRTRAPGQDIDKDWADARRHALRQALNVTDDRDTMRKTVAAIHALPIREELREILLPEQLEVIGQALESGKYLYTVVAFPERDADVGGRFVQWLKSDVNAISNRTILDGIESGFEFLLTTALDPPHLKKALEDLDPAGRCVAEACAVTIDGEKRLIPDEARQREQLRANAAQAADGADAVMRVRAGVVQSFLNGVGETLTGMTSLSGTVEAERADDALLALEAMAKTLDRDAADALRRHVQVLRENRRDTMAAAETLAEALRRLQRTALDLRVVPLDGLFNRLSRAVRDLAADQGKDVRMTVDGRDVRIDKTVVEKLGDPLLHMIRNSIDHGIETPDQRASAGKPDKASVSLRAFHRGSHVIMEIADDGRGLDVDRIRATAVRKQLLTERDAAKLAEPDVLRLIFRPGFSTAEQVTETSGRGVGMDVVLSTAQALGGDVDIRSQRGQGTTFVIRLPLTAALQAAVLVQADDQILAVPDRHVEEVYQAAPGEVWTVAAGRRLSLRGAAVPVFGLTQLLGQGKGRPEGAGGPLIILANGTDRVALEVDSLKGRREIYLKDLHPRLATISGVGGATIQGDGTVMLVLDGEGLIKMAHRRMRAAARRAAEA